MVLLVGIVLLIAVPGVRDTLLNDDLKAATRRLAGAARELRNEAVRERTDAILHLDLQQGALWSYAADATAEKRAELRGKAERLPAGIRIAGVRQIDAAEKADGEAVIRFFGRGYATPTVVRLAKGDRIFSLVFHPYLQAVSVYERDIDFPFIRGNRSAAP